MKRLAHPPGACCGVLSSSAVQQPSRHTEGNIPHPAPCPYHPPGACCGVLSSRCWKIWFSPLTESAAVYLQATPFSRYSTACVRLQVQAVGEMAHFSRPLCTCMLLFLQVLQSLSQAAQRLWPQRQRAHKQDRGKGT